MANIKDIPGFNGRYSVTDNGIVISNNYLRTGKQKALKPYKDSHGYYRVQLRKGEKGRGKDFPVHRLVAEAFCIRPVGKNYVDHIDGNTTNNNANNLRWVTQKENCNNPIAKRHYSDVKRGKNNPNYGKFGGLNHGAKAIIQLDAKTGEVIAEYPSQMDAVRQNSDLTQAGVSKCCTDNKKTHKGYKFRFK